MATVYLGLGSNLGNRKQTIDKALSLLTQEGINIIRCSRLIETTPVGGPSGQGPYLNGVVKVETCLSPLNLLDKLHTIEQTLGRKRTVKNGPRTIDLDILLYDDLKINSPRLTIPHPRMHERDFVVIPLKELDQKYCEELPHASL